MARRRKVMAVHETKCKTEPQKILALKRKGEKKIEEYIKRPE